RIPGVRDEARGRRGEPRRDPYVVDPVAERLANPLDELAVGVGLLAALVALGLALELAELEIALRDRDERLAFGPGPVRAVPLVGPVESEQHLDALLPEPLEMRAGLRREERVGGDVVDLVLALLHPRHVAGEGHVLLLGVGLRRGEPQELRDP